MKILLATDGSPPARAAQQFIARFPFAQPPDVHLLEVLEHPEWLSHDPSEDVMLREAVAGYRREAQLRLDEECAGLAGHVGSLTTEIRNGHSAAETIRAAAEVQADLLVVGARGHSLWSRLLIGSVSDKIAKYAPCSVLVVRPQERSADSPLRIVVAFDGSGPAAKAVERLSNCPLGAEAEITLLTVLPARRYFRSQVPSQPTPQWEAWEREAQEGLERAARYLRSATPNVATRILDGVHISEEIVTAADQWAADLIVVGHQGRSRIEEFLLGSVAYHVLHHAHCSVWIERG